MAGRKGRSGGARKNAGREPKDGSAKKQFVPPPKFAPAPADSALKPPTLKATTKSVEAFCAWVAKTVIGGLLDPSQAREANAAARTSLAAAREGRASAELEEHRALAKKIAQDRQYTERILDALHRSGVDVQTIVAGLGDDDEKDPT